MATTDVSNDDSLWNQSVCNKSWADIMAEEEDRLAKSSNSPLLRDSTNFKGGSVKIKEEPLDENACDIPLNGARAIKIEPNELLPNFSLSYVKTEPASPSSVKENKVNKGGQPKDFLQEDLSLTSHLNGFQLVSPCKTEPKTPTKTPSKNSISYFLRSDKKDSSSDTKVIKRKLQTDGGSNEISDEMLMPSPSKIRRQNTPMKTPSDKLLNRKRSREITPGKRSSEKKTPREIETDPDVLARRQKQIDYGKNTIGYDRYRQLVPKEARKKMHPRTPPLHLKFSRRAWDGLIKVWRQRLHFWDPPSEGGGNPACLEGSSDLSDTSSTEGSLPNTPVQDKKRQDRKKSWIAVERGSRQSNQPHDDDDDDDDQGCTPLPLEEKLP
ncbi:unnamed protein product [Nezara viridula]|uniref:Histone RNA hairpin-binding protein RNA-binding domain-containing protein n=1 Tax=Nezara viridula TaxID=85310 RepID=A0A9P0E2Y3_NEZVI|nr:unnamed protein product [Nezara viridula]